MSLINFIFGLKTDENKQSANDRKTAHDNLIIEKVMLKTGCTRKDIVRLPKNEWSNVIRLKLKCIVKDKYQIRENDYSSCYMVYEINGNLVTSQVYNRYNNIYTWRNCKVGDTIKIIADYDTDQNIYYTDQQFELDGVDVDGKAN